MNLKSLTRIALVCVGFTAATPIASARPFLNPDSPMAQEFQKIREDLALTRSQKSQIRQVLMGHKDEIKTQRAAGIEARQALKTATATHGPDSKETNAAADGIAAVAKSRALLVATIFSEVRPILTPEQIRTLESARESFLSKGL